MGGLFSSENKRKPEPQRRFNNTYYETHTYSRPSVTQTQTQPTTRPSLKQEDYYGYSYNVPTEYKSHINIVERPSSRYLAVPKVNLYKNVSYYCTNWESDSTAENTTTRLSEYDPEYQDMKNLFLSKTRRNFVLVSAIERIENPYLMGRYMLKKIKMRYIYGKHPQEMFLFHGTKSYYVDSICEGNFDWRKHGSGTGQRFGQGVSFSHVSHYASHYCDKSSVKVIIIAKVLLSETCIGNQHMDIPPYFNPSKAIRFDSSKKEDNKVMVKYDDDEFYPAYKIMFVVTNEQAYFQKPKKC